MGEGVSGKVAAGGHPVLVTDIESDSRFRDDALSRQGQSTFRSPSFLAVPLLHHGRLLGELNVAEKGSGEPYTRDDLRLLAILGGHVAGAISGAIAAEELRRANDHLENELVSGREALAETHRKRREAEAVTRGLARHLPVALAAFDGDLRVTFANEAARALLGLEPGGVLVPSSDRTDGERVAAAAAEMLTDGATRTVQCGGRASECGSGRLNVVVAPLRLPDGGVFGGTLVATPDACPLARLNGAEGGE